MAVLVNAFSNALKISLEEGRRIFERIQDVFARECVQECRKWCPKSCPMEFPGRLKLSILHGPHGGHGGPEPMQPQRITCGCIGCGRQMIPKRAQRRPKGWQKGVRGRGSPACLFQFGRDISIKSERCAFSILWNIDYFVGFIDKSETRVFTFVFVKKTDVIWSSKKYYILWTRATLRPNETSPLLKGTSRNVVLFRGSSENR